MFGYITLNRPEMKVKDLDRYRSYYCGLCHELLRRYGRRGQMLLSYDCTFLTILLAGVYEPPEEKTKTRCVRHPAVPHTEVRSRFTPYAADMNVLLAFLKAEDDWKDERKPSAGLYLAGLRRAYRNLRKRWPAQAKTIRKAIADLSAEEQKPLPRGKEELLEALDRAAGCTGRFLGKICAPYHDMWESDLYGTGYYLGKFIYIMDAWEDREKDRRSGNFNILAAPAFAEGPAALKETVKEVLMDTAACCCRHFERLPIVQNVDILRNILYSGIWVKFNERSV